MLLNDILDLSKIEAGKFQLDATVFEPESLLHETQNLFTGAAHAKQLQMNARWLGAPEQRYQGDVHRLRQMLSNLVGNAIKFTPQGRIDIEACELARESDVAVLEISVRDTGIGIAPDKIDLLFQPFSQADSSTTRNFGGSGLGLSIVRQLAKAMGGEAGIESQPGQGSRFWFRVHAKVLQKEADARQAGRPDSDQAGLLTAPVVLRGRVLVVEDNLVNRMVIESMLTKLGIEVLDMAHDGQQAVDAITQADPNAPGPDLILMDLSMPVLDGYAATERIRQWEAANQRPRLPIIALTADAFEEDRQRCLAEGMDDFLTKPISVATLTSVLSKWLTAAPAGQAPSVALKSLDTPAFAALLNELTPMLQHNKFAAIGRFRQLQSLVAGTAIAGDIDDLGLELDEMRFELVLQRLLEVAQRLQNKEL